MNKAKLSALCAKARGWHPKGIHWYTADGECKYRIDGASCSCPIYNPPDDANQADALLEYVADKLKCDWELFTEHYPESEGFPRKRYYCLMVHHECCESAETENLAKVLCALRASDKVTDAEINDAMEGE